MLRSDGLVTSVQKNETAGAVSRLRGAGLKAGLAEQRGLLIARHASDWQFAIEQARRCRSKDAAIVVDFGKHRFRYPEQPAQLRVPPQFMDIEQRCTARVGGVR